MMGVVLAVAVLALLALWGWVARKS